jgi:hypothetical protein
LTYIRQSFPIGNCTLKLYFQQPLALPDVPVLPQ